MSWVKIDDQFADHPKVIEAGPLASWLYVCGLTYCARYLTDGYIPRGQVRKLADIDNALELAEKLVSVGLWEYRDGGFWVHDYLVYNPSGEKVKAEREANLRRQAEWREKNRRDDGTFGENNGDDNNDCNGVNNGVTNGVTESVITTAPSPSPSPSPIPVPEPVPVSPKSSARASTPEREAVSAPAELRQPLQAFSFSEPDIGSAPSEQPEQPETSKPPDIREQCVQAIEYWRDIGKLRSVHSTDKDNITSLVKHYGFEQVKAAMDAERGRAIWHLQSRLMGKPIPRVESATVPA